ncbi:MAG: exodeoxyribonuclease V subunit alpha [Deltaproteobacteria bacterium]|nr:exodeoxyribonuclease V subunit alpha [Deltaproteobacteria bacterium]
MHSENLFRVLAEWVERGWIRSLDLAFARFLKEQQPSASGPVLLAAVLASHQLGRGHICLDLRAALADPEGALSLPPEGDEMQTGKPLELLSGMTPETWEQILSESPLVAAGPGNTPLVLSSGRLYLRRYWQYTQQVAQGILQRIADPLFSPDIRSGKVEDNSPDNVPEKLPENVIDRLDALFGPMRSPEELAKTEVHWQSVGAVIAAAGAFTVISGGPGTGKTTTVVQLLVLLQDLAREKGQNLRICLAAPTGKAAARLTESMGKAMSRLPSDVRKRLPLKATTLHRLLGSRPDSRRFVHNSQNPLHVDFLVVDEASMIDLEMMAALLGALPPGARLVLLGDKDQLASVEAGSVLGDICAHAEQAGYLPETLAWIEKNTGYGLKDFAGNGTALDQHVVVLRRSHRFGKDSGIGELARAVNAGDPEKVAAIWTRGFKDIAHLNVRTLDNENFVSLVLDGNPGAFARAVSTGAPAGYRAYLECVNAGPPQGTGAEDDWLRAVLDAFGRFQLLAAVRKGKWGVEGLNGKTAEILCRAGLIRATEGWYPGRPVMVTRNDYGLGVMNGDVGIVLPVTDDRGSGQKTLRAVFPMADGALKKVLPSRLNNVETVYAMTVHKSQGSEFEHTAMVLPDAMNPALTRELVYTGMTRARNWFTLVSPDMDILGQAVLRRTHRASGLGELLLPEDLLA